MHFPRWPIREIKIHVYAKFNGKREFVPRDQVFPFIVVYCLLLPLKNKKFQASFIHKDCSGLFLSAYFLFWEILNLNLTSAVWRKRES